MTRTASRRRCPRMASARPSSAPTTKPRTRKKEIFMSFRKALSPFMALLAFAFAGAAWSQAGPPYSLLTPPQPTDGGGKIEVIEFFWYGCPHCYALEPAVNAWLKSAPKDVVFRSEEHTS